MDTIKSKAQWVTSKISNVKEQTLDRLVEQYRATRELRRKKAEGIATPAELRKLEKKMRKIKIIAASVGVGLTIVAAIAGGMYRYGKPRKKKEEREVREWATQLEEGLKKVVEHAEMAEKGNYSSFSWDDIVSRADIPTQEVKKRLEAGQDPNESDLRGLPALYHAEI